MKSFVTNQRKTCTFWMAQDDIHWQEDEKEGVYWSLNPWTLSDSSYHSTIKKEGRLWLTSRRNIARIENHVWHLDYHLIILGYVNYKHTMKKINVVYMTWQNLACLQKVDWIVYIHGWMDTKIHKHRLVARANRKIPSKFGNIFKNNSHARTPGCREWEVDKKEKNRQ